MADKVQPKKDNSTLIAVAGAAGLVGLAVVMASKGMFGPNVRVDKKGGDTLVYKPTILNKGKAPTSAIVWCQLGHFTGMGNVGAWASLQGSEAQQDYTFPAGKTTLQIPVIVPTGAPVGSYDCRTEIRDQSGRMVWYQDFFDQVEITGG